MFKNFMAALAVLAIQAQARDLRSDKSKGRGPRNIVESFGASVDIVGETLVNDEEAKVFFIQNEYSNGRLDRANMIGYGLHLEADTRYYLGLADECPTEFSAADRIISLELSSESESSESSDDDDGEEEEEESV